MIEAGRAGRWRASAFAFPGVQSDVMVVAAGRQKCRLAPVSLREFEAEHVPVKRERPIKVGHLQMDMTDAHVRMKWL